MRRVFALLMPVVCALVPAAFSLGACTAATGDPAEGVDDDSGQRAAAISANDVVARAREWVAVQMPYCGGPNGGADVLCDGTCVRTGDAANPAWDAYRSDCSGLVSYAWGLPPPGRITTTLPEVASEISGWDLAPGDVLNNSYHVVLFAGWVNRDAGTAVIIHEPDCGRVATELTVTLGLTGSSYVSLFGDGYYALRFTNIEGASGGDSCDGLTYQGACEGNLLKWCENGGLRTYDCGANGKTCGWESDTVGNNCLEGGEIPQEVPQNDCNGVDYHGYCEGNTLVWCQEGQLKTYECGAETCGWQNDTEGNNCL